MEAQTCKRELVIEIPTEVVRREADSIAAQYRRVARIPGFRPGRAPATLVQRHFRADIRHEIVQSLLPKFFETAVKEQKLSIVGQPQFEDLKFEDDQPLTCKATFEVEPQFELKEYKGLEAEGEVPGVSDADVDEALNDLRERAATFEVVSDRPADDDDYLTVSYQGQAVQQAAARPIQVREAVVHLAGKGTVAAFTENLRGTRPGETRQFDVAYAEDFPQKSLAGKTIRYGVEVQSIKRKVVPPADDELAKTVSEAETLAEVRAKLRQGLEEQRAREARAATMRKLLDRLLAAHEFPVPETLIEAQLERKLESFISQLLGRGIDPRTVEIDWRKLREESRPEAEKEVRGALLLGRIAEAEGLKVSDEEVDEVIKEMAPERGETPAALKTRLTREGMLDRIKSARRNQKALEIIYQDAKISRKSEQVASPTEG